MSKESDIWDEMCIRDRLETSPIPKVKELNTEYAEILERKKRAYAEYRKIRPEMQNYQIALKVAEACVDDETEQEINQKEQEQPSVQR